MNQTAEKEAQSVPLADEASEKEVQVVEVKAPVITITEEVTVEKEVTVTKEDGTTETVIEEVVVFEEETTTVVAPDGTETTVPVVVAAPESKVGEEQTGADAFDIISRLLDTTSEFVEEVVVEEYVQ